MHAKRRTFVYSRVLLVRRAKKVVFSCAFGTGPSGVPAVLVRAHVFRVRSWRAMERPPPDGGGDAVNDSNLALGDPLALNTRDLSTPQSITRTDPAAAAQLSTAHHMVGAHPARPPSGEHTRRLASRRPALRCMVWAHRSERHAPLAAADFRGP